VLLLLIDVVWVVNNVLLFSLSISDVDILLLFKLIELVLDVILFVLLVVLIFSLIKSDVVESIYT
jgi:hypothetical protein